MKEFFKNLIRDKKRYWLTIGFIGYFLVALSSAIRSFTTGFFSNVYIAIDWFASCIIYFFGCALIGLVITNWKTKKTSKKRSKKTTKNSMETFPIWAILTLALWVVGITF